MGEEPGQRADDLQARLTELFAEELTEGLDTLAEGLVRLEQAPEAEAGVLVRELFRTAHSLKGAAQAAGASGVVAAAHRLEDVLGALRERGRLPDRDLLDELFTKVDDLASAAGSSLRADLAAGAPAPARSGEPAEEQRHGGARLGQVRVAAGKVDRILAAAGELRAIVETEQADIGQSDDSPARRRLRQAVEALEAEAHELRMQPFSNACQGVERAARDAARAAGKEVRVAVSGEAIELDREVATALREPLLHLVRNAVGHGIEPRDARVAAGKPPAGAVRISAAAGHGAVEVTVTDDGAGIDVVSLRSAARQHGVGDTVTDDELPFLPGLSSTAEVSAMTGRGVGLDAVRASVERLGGRVRLDSDPGRGTTVTVAVPVSLATLHVLFMLAGGERLAVPVASIDRLVRTGRDALHQVEGSAVLDVDGAGAPAVPLAGAIGLTAHGSGDVVHALVVDAGSRGHVALLVDGLLDEAEVAVQPLPERLGGVTWSLGAVILPAGDLALVLNPAACVRAGLAAPLPPLASPGESPDLARRVLLAEDSLTTRVLECSILEGAGYRVTAAADGAEAWRLLREHGADIVITDIDMPHMDGLALCRAVRGSSRFRHLPVVLVTSLADEADRRRGLEAGADAYFVKSDFEQGTLLETVERLL